MNANVKLAIIVAVGVIVGVAIKGYVDANATA